MGYDWFDRTLMVLIGIVIGSNYYWTFGKLLFWYSGLLLAFQLFIIIAAVFLGVNDYLGMRKDPNFEKTMKKIIKGGKK